ncbi:histidine kinase [Arcobacter sp. CECT 8986]|uniref:sensor histidine kinase n=1 Tax=Arcobacter sp. CECT 8986 TaxID=2044507 RepID=UPI00100987C3|nr:ATP-binding protein [Arcobacter sp. CECT 8986]RXK01103.1 histidine kinase [Arcobacter sp. CECT 8986]
MKNLKIRQKFLILGISILISLFFITWLAFKINQYSLENSKSIIVNFQDTQKIQAFYIEDLFTLREMILSLVISPNEKYKKQIDKKIIPMINSLDEKFSVKININKRYWNDYKKIALQTRDYSLKGQNEDAFLNTSTIERKKFYILIDDLKKVQTQKLNSSEKNIIKFKKSIDRNNIYLIFGVLTIGLIGLLLDLTVIMKLVRDIESVQKGLSNFFDYLKNPTDYKQTLNIDIKSNDELGLMSDAINEKVKQIKDNLHDDYELIKEATVTLNNLKQGCLGKRVKKEGKSKELNTLKNVMNEVIDSLENQIQKEIKHRTNQEKLMMQQSKLAAMGEMIGNIAHQWRQPLGEINAILMELETINKYSDLKKEYLLESIESCNTITQHMSNTINDFQNFFKPTKAKDNFSVLESCKKAIAIINASLQNSRIKLIFDVQEDNIIYGYSNEFSHAILNIISNAQDALVSRKIENPFIKISIKVGKKFTVIKISDNAKGVNLKDIDMIFEPYFTTKHAKQGTGIGLYMTKTIIEDNMQGFVSVKNTKEGALFTVKVK